MFDESGEVVGQQVIDREYSDGEGCDRVDNLYEPLDGQQPSLQLVDLLLEE
jgi:hypothetical protein